MKRNELIRLLEESKKDYPEDLDVRTEGCDCIGPAKDGYVNLEEVSPYFLITRDHGN